MTADIIEADETGSLVLSVRHETFALAVAAGNSYAAAYAAAYGIDGATPATRVSACKLAKHRGVVARVKELREAAAERSVISVRERMQWLDAIVRAEPVSTIVGCGCRHCWGADFHYQWRDDAELLVTATKAQKACQPYPDTRGGFGFRPDAQPNEACPHCSGKRTRIEVVPFDQMTAGQRALYRGVETFPDGSIKRVLIHDQLAAADQLNRMQAAYTSVNLSASMSVVSPSAPASTADILTQLRALRAPATEVTP